MTFDLGGRAAGATTAELRTAAALRWQRPLLTAELAEQACGRAVADGDELRWLQAAGWLLDGHAAGGDARDVATAVVAGVTGHVTAGDTTVPVPLRAPGTEVLTRPEGARLRVELAGVAQADGELEAARALVVGLPDDAPGEDPGLLRLDRLAVEVRCALAGASAAELERLRSDVDSCGSGFGGEPAAYADLVVGSVHRARREHDAAVDRALRGLAQLGWTPERPGARPLSTHLAAALLSQWITALLDSGHVPAEAVAAAAAQRDAADAGRQGVLLRLTLARVQAGRADHAARALVEAADGAEQAGVPALVAACRTAQSELHEGSGRYRDALEAMRAAMEADQIDRDRGMRFRAAMAALLPLADVLTTTAERPTPFPRTGGVPAAFAERPAAAGGTVAGAPRGGPGAGAREDAGRGASERGLAGTGSGRAVSPSGRDERARDERPTGTPVGNRSVGAKVGTDRPSGAGPTESDHGHPAGDRPGDDRSIGTPSRDDRSGGAGDDPPARPGKDGAAGPGDANGRPANDLPGAGHFPLRWAPSASLLLGPGPANGPGPADPSRDDRAVDRSAGANRNGRGTGDAGVAPGASAATGAPDTTIPADATIPADTTSLADTTGPAETAAVPDTTDPAETGDTPDTTGHPGTARPDTTSTTEATGPDPAGPAEAAGAADCGADGTTSSGRERPTGIDPADPLGISGLLTDEPASRTPRDPSWTGPSWTPDAAGGSPLADALLAEWRTPEPPPAVPRNGAHVPAESGRRNGTRRNGAHRSGEDHGADPADEPGRTGDHRNGSPVPEPTVVADRAAPEPPPADAGTPTGRASGRDGTRAPETGRAATPTAPATPTGPPGPAERSIVLDLVDGDLETVTGTAAVGALHDVVVRTRRLVPPSGTTRRDDDTVRVTLPDVDHVTVLLWARSLATHLGARVRRGGLPAGTSLRMQAVGPHGVEGEEIVTELTGPDTPAPLPEAPPFRDRVDGHSATAQNAEADRSDGGGSSAPEPVAGPALATPLDLTGGGAGRGGRRRAGGDAATSLSAVGLTVRPGSGGRRRSDGPVGVPTTPDRTVRDLAGPGPGGPDRASGSAGEPRPITGDEAVRAPSGRGAAGTDSTDPESTTTSQVWGGSAPVDRTSAPDPLDTRFALPPEPDRRLAEAVRAHLDLPGTDGAASRHDGPARERSGLPVRWSGVDDGAGESALPRRRGRDATAPPDDGHDGTAGLFDGDGTTSVRDGGHRHDSAAHSASRKPDGSGAGTWTLRTATGPTVVRGAPAVVAPATDDGAATSGPSPANGASPANGPDTASGSTTENGPATDPQHAEADTPATSDDAPSATAEHTGATEPGTIERPGTTERSGKAEYPGKAESPGTTEHSGTTERPETTGRPGTTSSPTDETPGTPATPSPSEPTAIPEDMGLADLLAGALAAYREI